VPLFKTPDQLMALGQDLMLRGDFSSSKNKYEDAAEKYRVAGNPQMAVVAHAYAQLMALGAAAPGVTEYAAAAQALSPLGDYPLKLGPRQVPASTLAREAGLLAEQSSLAKSTPHTPADWSDVARRNQALSMEFRQLGNQNLLLPELFRHETMNPAQLAPSAAARAEEAMGEAVVLDHPKEAAEHNENARNWWAQAGDLMRAQEAANRVQLYGRSARCWFCGREVTGEGVQYVLFASDIGPWSSVDSGAGLGSVDPSRGSILACRGCASAIDRIADQHAIERAKEVEVKLEAEIQRLEEQIRRIPR
jgi:hypothetical protein